MTLRLVATIVLLVAATAGCQSEGSDRVATVAEQDLTRPGTLRICSDLSRAPLEYRGSDGVVRGFEVDLLEEIATRLELGPEWVEKSRPALVDAVVAQRCDVIAASLPTRSADQRRIEELSYLAAPISVLIRDEDPAPLAVGLCGRPIGALAGTREVEILLSYSEECARNDRPPIRAVVVSTTSEAHDRLRDGWIDALFDELPVNDWFARRETDRFDEGGTVPREDVHYAIGFGKGKNSLRLGMQSALLSMHADGTFAALLERWGLEDVVQPLKVL